MGLSKKEHTLFIYKAVHCHIKKIKCSGAAPNAIKAAKSEAVIKKPQQYKNKIKSVFCHIDKDLVWQYKEPCISKNLIQYTRPKLGNN